jgi:hypothetical protein
LITFQPKTKWSAAASPLHLLTNLYQWPRTVRPPAKMLSELAGCMALWLAPGAVIPFPQQNLSDIVFKSLRTMRGPKETVPRHVDRSILRRSRA